MALDKADIDEWVRLSEESLALYAKLGLNMEVHGHLPRAVIALVTEVEELRAVGYVAEVSVCGDCQFYRPSDRDGPELCEHPTGGHDRRLVSRIGMVGRDRLAADCPLIAGDHVQRTTLRSEARKAAGK
jgi:hypothetical protein